MNRVSPPSSKTWSGLIPSCLISLFTALCLTLPGHPSSPTLNREYTPRVHTHKIILKEYSHLITEKRDVLIENSLIFPPLALHTNLHLNLLSLLLQWMTVFLFLLNLCSRSHLRFPKSFNSHNYPIPSCLHHQFLPLTGLFLSAHQHSFDPPLIIVPFPCSCSE